MNCELNPPPNTPKTNKTSASYIKQQQYMTSDQITMTSLELAQQIQYTIELFSDATHRKIRDLFEAHPVFVLFEPALNCDPATDHINPKNIYPLYKDKLSNIFKEIRTVNEQYLQNLIKQQLAQTMYPEIDKRITIESDFNYISLKNQRAEKYNQYLQQYIKTKLETFQQVLRDQKREIATLREQLLSKHKISTLFQPDYLDFQNIDNALKKLRETQSELISAQQFNEDLLKINLDNEITIQNQKKIIARIMKYGFNIENVDILEQQLENIFLNADPQIFCNSMQLSSSNLQKQNQDNIVQQNKLVEYGQQLKEDRQNQLDILMLGFNNQLDDKNNEIQALKRQVIILEQQLEYDKKQNQSITNQRISNPINLQSNQIKNNSSQSKINNEINLKVNFSNKMIASHNSETQNIKQSQKSDNNQLEINNQHAQEQQLNTSITDQMIQIKYTNSQNNNYQNNIQIENIKQSKDKIFNDDISLQHQLINQPNNTHSNTSPPGSQNDNSQNILFDNKQYIISQFDLFNQQMNFKQKIQYQEYKSVACDTKSNNKLIQNKINNKTNNQQIKADITYNSEIDKTSQNQQISKQQLTSIENDKQIDESFLKQQQTNINNNMVNILYQMENSHRFNQSEEQNRQIQSGQLYPINQTKIQVDKQNIIPNFDIPSIQLITEYLQNDVEEQKSVFARQEVCKIIDKYFDVSTQTDLQQLTISSITSPDSVLNFSKSTSETRPDKIQMIKNQSNNSVSTLNNTNETFSDQNNDNKQYQQNKYQANKTQAITSPTIQSYLASERTNEIFGRQYVQQYTPVDEILKQLFQTETESINNKRAIKQKLQNNGEDPNLSGYKLFGMTYDQQTKKMTQKPTTKQSKIQTSPSTSQVSFRSLLKKQNKSTSSENKVGDLQTIPKSDPAFSQYIKKEARLRTVGIKDGEFYDAYYDLVQRK
ncbi:Conserved_hypothetical protein [Hexamita inflata]|uniref:Uncharacterized protein n=1 Tax=Hexamita inflata TaxID=28002 RepID=A0AA86P9J6_9EUKA|nr:Conserved hypothetical protein [Hexamita inflata]CAI9969346.1 Conserved hypothetical protein [Hexamita inflata]